MDTLRIKSYKFEKYKYRKSSIILKKMSEYEKIEKLKEKLQEQLNFIMKQKKVMEIYKQRTNEEINKLRHDNKKLIERYMKIDRPINFTIQRPVARKLQRGLDL